VSSGVNEDAVSVIGNPLTQVLAEFVNSAETSHELLSKEFSLDSKRKTIFFL